MHSPSEFSINDTSFIHYSSIYFIIQLLIKKACPSVILSFLPSSFLLTWELDPAFVSIQAVKSLFSQKILRHCKFRGDIILIVLAPRLLTRSRPWTRSIQCASEKYALDTVKKKTAAIHAANLNSIQKQLLSLALTHSL